MPTASPVAISPTDNWEDFPAAQAADSISAAQAKPNIPAPSPSYPAAAPDASPIQPAQLAPSPSYPSAPDLPLPPEQVARNLMDAVNNPLSVSAPRQPAQPPPDPVSAKAEEFLPEATPVERTSSPTEFLPEAAQTQKPSEFLPEASTPVDSAQQLSAQMQQHEQSIRDLSAKYDHDPETAMEELSKDSSVDPEKALQAIQFAQVHDKGEGDYYSDFNKLLDGYINGAKAVGSFIKGVYNTVTNPLAIPNQIGSTTDTAIQAVNPEGTGSNPLKPISGQANLLGAPNTAWSHADLIHPQQLPDDMTPEKQAQRQNSLNNEAQQSQRTLVAGTQEGVGQNLQMVEQAVNTALGIYQSNPVTSWIRALGGPLGPISPKDQISLMLQKTPIPIRSSEAVTDMDPDALRAEFMVRRMQNNLSVQRQAGHVSSGGESLLDTWNNGVAKTPEQLADAGYPISPTKVGDVAGTANLALTIPEISALDGILGATGVKSLLGTVAGRGLQGAGLLTETAGDLAATPFDLGAGAAKGTAKFLKENPSIVGYPLAETIRNTLRSTGIELPSGEFGNFIFSKPIGQLATPLVSGPLQGIGWGLGWGSKLIQGLSDPVADWLNTAGSDLISGKDMLATRSPVGNFVGKVAQNVATGTAEALPLAYAVSPNNAEQQGEFVGYGVLGHALPKLFSDATEAARNTLGDQIFIRDPSVMRGNYVAPDTNYGTNPTWDKNSLANINAVVTKTGPFGGEYTEPSFNPAQKQTFANTRAALADQMEIHLATPSQYQTEITRLAKQGIVQNPDFNSRGVFVDTSAGKPQVFVRTDHFNDAFEHEVAHGAVAKMTPDEQEAMFQLQAKRNNPDLFTSNYTKGAANALIDLPTEAGIKAGTEQYRPGPLNGLSQEDIKREMVVEAVSSLFKGDSIANFTRNPTLLRNAQTALGGILGRMGFDPTTIRSQSILGVQPSLPSALVLDSVVRDALQRNRTTFDDNGSGPPPPKKNGGGPASPGGPTNNGGPPPAPPASGPIDESMVKGLQRKGFTREQALKVLGIAQQQGGIVSGQPTAVPKQPVGTSQASQPATTAPQPQNAPQSPPVEPQQPTQEQAQPAETTQESAITQRVLRENGLTPGEAQELVNGKGEARPPLAHHGRGNIGAFGYAGDATPDTRSLRGIGAFPHTSKPGSMIDGYSAGLTKEGAALRHVQPGQEFIGEDGKTYRYDDTAPSYWNGHKIPDDYIDVYSPHHAPDKGVSAEQIARNQAIIDGAGIGSASKRGPLTAGEQPKGPISPGQAAVEHATGQPTPQSEAKAPIIQQDVTASEQKARSTPQKPDQSNADYENQVYRTVIDDVGPKHAAGLDPSDQRVQLDPASGYLAGKFFDPNDAFNQFLLQKASPHDLQILNQIQDAIRNRTELTPNYFSAPNAEKGLTTARGRAEAQAESTAKDRAAGSAPGQQAGKSIMASWVGVGKDGALLAGGIDPAKMASNFPAITMGLGPKSPYGAGPMGPAAVEDLAGWLSNHEANYKGDGSGPLIPVPGAKIPPVDPDHVPYLMSPEKSAFWNLAMEGGGSKLSTRASAERSAVALDLARANEGYNSPEGYVNKLAETLDKTHGPQPVLNKDGTPKLNKSGKPVTESWTAKHLHSAHEMLRLDNIRDLEGTSPKIHPGQELVGQLLHEKGLGTSIARKAGFMPGKEIVSPNVHENTDFDYARKALWSQRHQDAKDFARQVEAAAAKAYGYKAGDVRDGLGDWGDGAENSLITHTTDTPFNAARIKVALKTLHSAQKQGIAWEDHYGGDHAMYTLRFNKTPAEVRDIMQEHGLQYKTIAADGKPNEPTEAYVLDTDGSAGRSVAQLAHAPIHDTGLGSAHVRLGHGEFIGDPEGVSRDVAATNSRRIVEEGLGQGRDQSGRRFGDLRDLSSEAERSYGELKQQSGKASWMPAESAGADPDEVADARKAWAQHGTDSPYFRRWFGSSKVTDDSGKPQVVYHGTNIGFDQFETGKGSNTGAKSGLEGHFFTSKPEEAQQYGAAGVTGRVKELTAQMEALKAQSQKEVNEKGFDFDRVMLAQERYSALEAQRKAIHDEARQSGDYLVAAQGSNIMPSYLRIENPLEVDMKCETRPEEGELQPVIAKAKAEGHDGVILRNTYDQVFDSGKPTYGTSDIFMPFDSKQIKSATGNRGTFDRQSGKVNYMPGNVEAEDSVKPYYDKASNAYFMPGIPGKDTVPVEYTKNRNGEDVALKVPYDIVQSPLIANHQPTDKITKDSPDKMPTDQYQYLTKSARQRLTALDDASATTTFANKIVAEARRGMKDPEIAAGEGWYARMRKLLSDAFGKDHELFAHLLGVTSPMENPTSNFLYAYEAYQKYKNGDYDRHISKYQQAHEMRKAGTLAQHVEELTGKSLPTNAKGEKSDAAAMAAYIRHHDIEPLRDNGLRYGFHTDGVLQALARTWMEEAHAPKTKNYAGNLLSDKTTQATIDTWASRMMRRLGYQGGNAPWRLMPESEKAPSDLDFAFSQRAFDIAAKKMGMDADSLQAICWFFEKDLWERKNWMRSGTAGAEKSSLDVPFHAAFPQGPKSPGLPHAAVRIKLQPAEESLAK